MYGILHLQSPVSKGNDIWYAKWAYGAWTHTEASKTFPITKLPPPEPVIRAVLPNRVEVEVSVPHGWPANGQHLQLVAMLSPSASVNLYPLERQLQQQGEELGRLGLAQFLQKVFDAVEAARA